jgi:hypothetical protein
VVGVALWLAAAGAAACEDDDALDGWARVASGDTYGEWELFAEYEDGDWTGCLRFGDDDASENCADPDADDLVTFESGDGATFGAVPKGATLEFDDGRDVPLVDDRFFVVASEADVRLSD